ncbi:MAG: HAD family phosphatase [Thaumarchaeota archaeon]|nr:HAD family phosphatase [Nitrososphaerota archaeon]
MIEAVLLDMDGTLIEFNYNYVSARRLIIAKLVEMGVEESILSESKPAPVNVEDAVMFMRRKGFSEEELRILRRKAYEVVEPMELEAASNPVLRKGVSDLLSWLMDNGVKTAVCTNNCSTACEIVLRKTRLKRFFTHVLTRDDVERLKPFPDIIIKACEKLCVPPEKTVYVGDSPIDITAARSARVKPIGIVSSLCNAEKLKNAGAELVVSSMDELKEQLKRIIRVSPLER